MALTQVDIQEILSAIRAESQSVDEFRLVSTLDGINTLPAIHGNEVVSVPIA